MHGKKPLVSIGLPVYNGASYLSEAIDSLLAQSFCDFEIVISDNASTDDTQSICEDYAKLDRRLRYYREEINRGPYWNFNHVFELSRGIYFKWAASDDICAPEFLQRCVDALQNDLSIVCCHAWTHKIDTQGNLLANLPDPTCGGLYAKSGKRRLDASSHITHQRFADVLLASGWGAPMFGCISV